MRHDPPDAQINGRLIRASIRLNRAFIALGVVSVAASGYLVASAIGLLMALAIMMMAMSRTGVVPDFAPSLGAAVADPQSGDVAFFTALKATSLTAGYAVAVVVAALLLAVLLWSLRRRPQRGRDLPEGLAGAARSLMPTAFQTFRLFISDRTTVRRAAFFLDGGMAGRLRAVQRDGPNSPEAGPMRFVLAHEIAHFKAADHRSYTLSGPLALAAGAGPALFIFFVALFSLGFDLPSAGLLAFVEIRVAVMLLLSAIAAFVVFRIMVIDMSAFVHVKEWFADRVARIETGEQPYGTTMKREGPTDLWRRIPAPAERRRGMEDGTPRAVLLAQMLILKWLILRLIGAIVVREPAIAGYLYLIAIDAVFIALVCFGWSGLKEAWPKRFVTLTEGLTAPLLIVLAGLLPWGIYYTFLVRESLGFAGITPFWAVALVLMLAFPLAPIMVLGAIIRITPDIDMRGGLWINRPRMPRRIWPVLLHWLARLGDLISATLVAVAIYAVPPTLLLVYRRQSGEFDAMYAVFGNLLPGWVLAIDPVLALLALALAIVGGFNVFQRRRISLIGEAALMACMVVALTYGFAVIENAFSTAASGIAPSPIELITAITEVQAPVVLKAALNSVLILLPLALLYWCRWTETLR